MKAFFCPKEWLKVQGACRDQREEYIVEFTIEEIPQKSIRAQGGALTTEKGKKREEGILSLKKGRGKYPFRGIFFLLKSNFSTQYQRYLDLSLPQREVFNAGGLLLLLLLLLGATLLSSAYLHRKEMNVLQIKEQELLLKHQALNNQLAPFMKESWRAAYRIEIEQLSRVMLMLLGELIQELDAEIHFTEIKFSPLEKEVVNYQDAELLLKGFATESRLVIDLLQRLETLGFTPKLTYRDLQQREIERKVGKDREKLVEFSFHFQSMKRLISVYSSGEALSVYKAFRYPLYMVILRELSSLFLVESKNSQVLKGRDNA